MRAYTILFVIVLSSFKADAVSQKSQDGPLNILVMTVPARGHVNPLLRVSKALSSQGHNVTFMVGTDEASFPSLRSLVTSYYAHPFIFQMEQFPFANPTSFLNKAMKVGMFTALRTMLFQYSGKAVELFNQTLRTHNYDLVIGNEFLLASIMCINSQWEIPVVLMGTTMPFFISEQPQWPWPGLLQGQVSDNLSFFQRLVSLVEGVFVKHIFNYFLVRPQYLAVSPFCPSMTTKQLYEGPGVYLPHIVPTVIGFEFPRTQTPLMSYVGPNFPEDSELLSEHPKLKEWMDGKPERSVVYVSMGSMYSLNKEAARSILEGVMKTKYNLLWSLKKHNHWILDEYNIDKERVFISAWTPQASVLASKTIHCAILHGGFNGLSEALWNGVPIIGLPQMIEQSLNVGRLLHNKLGLQLNSNTLTISEVEQAVLTLEKDEYRSNVNKLRKMFKMAGGINRTVELLEFYGREGYSHLIPAHAKYHWSWIEFYNADVWLVLIAALLLLIFLTFKGFKLLAKLFRCSEKLKQQ